LKFAGEWHRETDLADNLARGEVSLHARQIQKKKCKNFKN
jgi:hypothetical protein